MKLNKTMKLPFSFVFFSRNTTQREVVVVVGPSDHTTQHSTKMFVYQTYRRIDVPSRSLCLTYYVGVLLVLALMFPMLMMRPHLRHMKTITLSSSGGGDHVTLTSFLASDHGGQKQHSDDGEDADIVALHRRCEKTRGCRHGDVSECRCEHWDWMELIESSTQQLHLTLAVQDVVETRRRANRTGGETRANARWSPLKGSEDFFFTVNPEHLLLRWTQRISLTATAQHNPSSGAALPGLLASAETCERLRSGQSVSLQGDHLVTDGGGSRASVIRLDGNGDDRFSLAQLLNVLPDASRYLVTSPPRKGVPLHSDGVVPTTSILSNWTARHGVELQVTSEFLNTIPPLSDVAQTVEEEMDNAERWWWPSQWQRVSSDIFAGFRPGPLQYLVCVKVASSHASDQSHGPPVNAATRPSDANDVFSLFTAPSDWSRKLVEGNPTSDDDHGSERRRRDGVDMRLLRKVFTARIHFSARANIAVYDTSTLLQFIGSTMGFVSLPWLLTEFLIGLLGQPTFWFSSFLLRMAPPPANRRDKDKTA